MEANYNACLSHWLQIREGSTKEGGSSLLSHPLLSQDDLLNYAAAIFYYLRSLHFLAEQGGRLPEEITAQLMNTTIPSLFQDLTACNRAVADLKTTGEWDEKLASIEEGVLVWILTTITIAVALVHLNAPPQESQEPFAVVLAHRIAEPVSLLDSAVLSCSEHAHAVLCLSTLLSCAKATSFKQSASLSLMRVCLHRMSSLLQHTLAQLGAFSVDEISSRSDTLAEQDCLLHPWNSHFLSETAPDAPTLEALLSLSHTGWPTPVLSLLGKLGCIVHMAELLERALVIQLAFQQTDTTKVPAQMDEKAFRSLLRVLPSVESWVRSLSEGEEPLWIAEIALAAFSKCIHSVSMLCLIFPEKAELPPPVSSLQLQIAARIRCPRMAVSKILFSGSPALSICATYAVLVRPPLPPYVPHDITCLSRQSVSTWRSTLRYQLPGRAIMSMSKGRSEREIDMPIFLYRRRELFLTFLAHTTQTGQGLLEKRKVAERGTEVLSSLVAYSLSPTMNLLASERYHLHLIVLFCARWAVEACSLGQRQTAEAQLAPLLASLLRLEKFDSAPRSVKGIHSLSEAILPLLSAVMQLLAVLLRTSTSLAFNEVVIPMAHFAVRMNNRAIRRNIEAIELWGEQWGPPPDGAFIWKRQNEISVFTTNLTELIDIVLKKTQTAEILKLPDQTLSLSNVVTFLSTLEKASTSSLFCFSRTTYQLTEERVISALKILSCKWDFLLTHLGTAKSLTFLEATLLPCLQLAPHDLARITHTVLTFARDRMLQDFAFSAALYNTALLYTPQVEMRRQLICVMQSFLSEDRCVREEVSVDLAEHVRCSLRSINFPVDNSDGTTTVVWTTSSSSTPTTASAVLKSRQPLWTVLEASLPDLAQHAQHPTKFRVSKLDCEAVVLQGLLHANLSALKSLRSAEGGNWSWLSSPSDLLDEANERADNRPYPLPDILTRFYPPSAREAAADFVKALALSLLINLIAHGLRPSVTSAFTFLLWAISPKERRAMGDDEEGEEEGTKTTDEPLDLTINLETFRCLREVVGNINYVRVLFEDWSRCPPIDSTLPELVLVFSLDCLLDSKAPDLEDDHLLRDELIASLLNCIGLSNYKMGEAESHKLVAHLLMTAYARKAAPVILWAVRLMSLMSVEPSLSFALKEKLIRQKLSLSPLQATEVYSQMVAASSRLGNADPLRDFTSGSWPNWLQETMADLTVLDVLWRCSRETLAQKSLHEKGDVICAVNDNVAGVQMNSCRLLGHLSGATLELSACVRNAEQPLQSVVDVHALLADASLVKLHLRDLVSSSLRRLLSPDGLDLFTASSMLSVLLFALKAEDLEADQLLYIDATQTLLLLTVSLSVQLKASRGVDEQLKRNLRIAILSLKETALVSPGGIVRAWRSCLVNRSWMLSKVAAFCLPLLQRRESSFYFLLQQLSCASPLGALQALSIAASSPDNSVYLLAVFRKALTDLPTLLLESSCSIAMEVSPAEIMYKEQSAIRRDMCMEHSPEWPFDYKDVWRKLRSSFDEAELVDSCLIPYLLRMDDPRRSPFLFFAVNSISNKSSLVERLGETILASKKIHQDAIELAVATLGPICALTYMSGLDETIVPVAERHKILRSLMAHLLENNVFADAQSQSVHRLVPDEAFFFAVVLSYKSVFGSPSVADLILLELFLMMEEGDRSSSVFKTTFLELLSHDASLASDLKASKGAEWILAATKMSQPLHRQWFFGLMSSWLNLDMDESTLREICDLITHVVSRFAKCEQVVDEIDPASALKAPVRPLMRVSAEATAALAARAQPFQETCRQTLAAFLLQAQTPQIDKRVFRTLCRALALTPFWLKIDSIYVNLRRVLAVQTSGILTRVKTALDEVNKNSAASLSAQEKSKLCERHLEEISSAQCIVATMCVTARSAPSWPYAHLMVQLNTDVVTPLWLIFGSSSKEAVTLIANEIFRSLQVGSHQLQEHEVDGLLLGVEETIDGMAGKGAVEWLPKVSPVVARERLMVNLNIHQLSTGGLAIDSDMTTKDLDQLQPRGIRLLFVSPLLMAFLRCFLHFADANASADRDKMSSVSERLQSALRQLPQPFLPPPSASSMATPASLLLLAQLLFGSTRNSEALDAAATALNESSGFVALWNRRGLPLVLIREVYDRCCEHLRRAPSSALTSLLAMIDLDRLPSEAWSYAAESPRLVSRLAGCLEPSAAIPIQLRGSELIIPQLLRRRDWSGESEGCDAAAWLLANSGMTLEQLHEHIGAEVGKGISAIQPSVLFTSGIDDDILYPYIQLALKTSPPNQAQWLGPAITAMVRMMWTDPSTPTAELSAMRNLLEPLLPSPSAFFPVLMGQLHWDMESGEYLADPAGETFSPESVALLQKRFPFLRPAESLELLLQLIAASSFGSSETLPLLVVSQLATLLSRDEGCVAGEAGLLFWNRLKDWFSTRLIQDLEATDPAVICFAHLFLCSQSNEAITSMQAISLLSVLDHLMASADHSLLVKVCQALGQKTPLPEMLSTAVAAVSRCSGLPDEAALIGFTTARPVMSSQLSTSNTLRQPVRVKHFLWSSLVVFLVEAFASLGSIGGRSSCAPSDGLPHLFLVANPSSGGSSFTDIFTATDLAAIKKLSTWPPTLSLQDDTQTNSFLISMASFTLGLLQGLMADGANGVSQSLAFLLASWIVKVLPSLETQAGTLSLVKVIEGLEAQMVAMHNELGLSVTATRKPKTIYSDAARVLHRPWGAHASFHSLTSTSAAPFQRVILAHLQLTFAFLRPLLSKLPTSTEPRSSSSETFISHLAMLLATPARFAYSKKIISWTLAELSYFLCRWHPEETRRLLVHLPQRFSVHTTTSPPPTVPSGCLAEQIDSMCIQFLNDLGNLCIALSESSLATLYRDVCVTCVEVFQGAGEMKQLLILRCLSIDQYRQNEAGIIEDLNLLANFSQLDHWCQPDLLLLNLDLLLVPGSIQTVLLWLLARNAKSSSSSGLEREVRLVSVSPERRIEATTTQMHRIKDLISSHLGVSRLVSLISLSKSVEEVLALALAHGAWHDENLSQSDVEKRRRAICAILSSPIWSNPLSIFMRDAALRILRRAVPIYGTPPTEGVVLSLISMVADSETNLGLRHQCHTGLREFPLVRDSKLPRILALRLAPWSDQGLVLSASKPFVSTLLFVTEKLEIDLPAPLLARLGEGVGLQEQTAGMLIAKIAKFGNVLRPTPCQVAALHTSVNQFISLTKPTYMHESLAIGLRRWLSDRNPLTQAVLSVWQSRDFVSAQSLCQHALLQSADHASRTDTSRSARLERFWNAAVKSEETQNAAAAEEEVGYLEPMLRLDTIPDITTWTTIYAEASRRTNQWSALTEFARFMSVSLHADCAAKLQDWAALEDLVTGHQLDSPLARDLDALGKMPQLTTQLVASLRRGDAVASGADARLDIGASLFPASGVKSLLQKLVSDEQTLLLTTHMIRSLWLGAQDTQRLLSRQVENPHPRIFLELQCVTEAAEGMWSMLSFIKEFFSDVYAATSKATRPFVIDSAPAFFRVVGRWRKRTPPMCVGLDGLSDLFVRRNFLFALVGNLVLRWPEQLGLSSTPVNGVGGQQALAPNQVAVTQSLQDIAWTMLSFIRSARKGFGLSEVAATLLTRIRQLPHFSAMSPNTPEVIASTLEKAKLLMGVTTGSSENPNAHLSQWTAAYNLLTAIDVSPAEQAGGEPEKEAHAEVAKKLGLGVDIACQVMPGRQDLDDLCALRAAVLLLRAKILLALPTSVASCALNPTSVFAPFHNSTKSYFALIEEKTKITELSDAAPLSHSPFAPGAVERIAALPVILELTHAALSVCPGLLSAWKFLAAIRDQQFFQANGYQVRETFNSAVASLSTLAVLRPASQGPFVAARLLLMLKRLNEEDKRACLSESLPWLASMPVEVWLPHLPILTLRASRDQCSVCRKLVEMISNKVAAACLHVPVMQHIRDDWEDLGMKLVRVATLPGICQCIQRALQTAQSSCSVEPEESQRTRQQLLMTSIVQPCQALLDSLPKDHPLENCWMTPVLRQLIDMLERESFDEAKDLAAAELDCLHWQAATSLELDRSLQRLLLNGRPYVIMVVKSEKPGVRFHRLLGARYVPGNSLSSYLLDSETRRCHLELQTSSLDGVSGVVTHAVIHSADSDAVSRSMAMAALAQGLNAITAKSSFIDSQSAFTVHSLAPLTAKYALSINSELTYNEESLARRPTDMEESSTGQSTDLEESWRTGRVTVEASFSLAHGFARSFAADFVLPYLMGVNLERWTAGLRSSRVQRDWKDVLNLPRREAEKGLTFSAKVEDQLGPLGLLGVMPGLVYELLSALNKSRRKPALLSALSLLAELHTQWGCHSDIDTNMAIERLSQALPPPNLDPSQITPPHLAVMRLIQQARTLPS